METIHCGSSKGVAAPRAEVYLAHELLQNCSEEFLRLPLLRIFVKIVRVMNYTCSNRTYANITIFMDGTRICMRDVIFLPRRKGNV